MPGGDGTADKFDAAMASLGGIPDGGAPTGADPSADPVYGPEFSGFQKKGWKLPSIKGPRFSIPSWMKPPAGGNQSQNPGINWGTEHNSWTMPGSNVRNADNSVSKATEGGNYVDGENVSSAIVDQVAAATGGAVTPEQKASLLSRLNNGLKKEVFGKSLREHAALMIGGYGIKTGTRLLLQYSTGGFVAAGVGGALVGAARGGYTEYKRLNQNPDLATQNEALSAQKRLWKEGLAGLAKGKKTRVTLAALQGGATGAVSALIGAEISDLMSGYGPQMMEWAKGSAPLEESADAAANAATPVAAETIAADYPPAPDTTPLPVATPLPGGTEIPAGTGTPFPSSTPDTLTPTGTPLPGTPTPDNAAAYTPAATGTPTPEITATSTPTGTPLSGPPPEGVGMGDPGPDRPPLGGSAPAISPAESASGAPVDVKVPPFSPAELASGGPTGAAQVVAENAAAPTGAARSAAGAAAGAARGAAEAAPTGVPGTQSMAEWMAQHANEVKVVDIKGGDNVIKLLTENGERIVYGAADADLLAVNAAANWDLLTETWDNMEKIGLKPERIPLNQLNALREQAANGDINAQKKLQELLHWIPTNKKFRIVGKAALPGAIGLLKQLK